MMGQCCQKQCDRLEKSYTQAFTNLEKDCKYLEGGNIPETVVSFMEECCTQGGNIEVFIHECGILHRPNDYAHLRYEAEPELELRRVVPIDTFIKYHLNNQSFNALDIRKHLLENCCNCNSEDEQMEELNGRVHKENAVCWWTFSLPKVSEPTDGNKYIMELALHEKTLTAITQDNAFIEIILSRSQLQTIHLFKPTSIEGFEENTRFVPEVNGEKYGKTQPIASQGYSDLIPRPELVSESFSYLEFKISKIKIKCWSCYDSGC